MVVDEFLEKQYHNFQYHSFIMFKMVVVSTTEEFNDIKDC